MAGKLNLITGVPAAFWNQAQANYVAHCTRLNRQLFVLRPRTAVERHHRRVLAPQAALATARDLRDYPESRVPDVMDIL